MSEPARQASPCPPTHRRARRWAALVAAWAVVPCSGCERGPVRASDPVWTPFPAATVVDEVAADARERMRDFAVAPPFVVELAACEPALKNPVAFALDPHGRAFVAETDRYLQSVFDITQQAPWLRDDLSFRTVADRRAFLDRTFSTDPGALTAVADVVRMLEDRDGDGRSEATTLLPVAFGAPEAGPVAGVLVHATEPGSESVFVACIPDLVRIDLRGGQARVRTLLTGFGVHIGVSGHDLHGLALGPDERLYFTVGDRGAAVTTQEGRRIDLPDTGAVLRCELDGSALEVVATGLRNPQELAFDRLGNLITVDNDTAGTDPTRVLHIVAGGDYGWRTGYQHQPDFGLWQAERIWEGVDDVLPSAGQVAQGPAGLVYAPGTGLADELRDHFLVCDFPGGVRAFRLEARGASFAAVDNRKILWGLWPTDLACGVDGALYVSDWVQGWRKPERGRIYRLVDPARRGSPALLAVQNLLRAGCAGRSTSELVELLAHPDLRVRQAAHFALAARADAATATALAAALAPGQPAPRRLHALWASAIRARRGDVAAGEAVSTACRDADPDLRASALAAAPASAALEATALTLLDDPEPRVRLQAALALARCRVGAGGSDPGQRAARLLDRLRVDGGDAFLQHALVAALDAGAALAVLADRGDSATVAERRGVLLALRRARDPRIVGFLADADHDLVAAAVRAIHDVPIDSAMPALLPLVQRADLPASVRARMHNACVRLGTAVAASALVAGALRAETDTATQLTALRALARWPQPDPIDPVLGLWRPVPPRAAAPARDALAAALPALLAQAAPAVGAAALAAADALDVREVGARSAALAADVDRPWSLRVAALGVAVGRRSAGAEDLAASMLAEVGHAADTGRARDLLEAVTARLEPPPSAATGFVLAVSSLLRDGRDVPVLQAALACLARVPRPAGVAGDGPAERQLDAALSELAARVRAEPTLAALALDVREALQRRCGASAERAAAWPPTDDELLVGGDRARGRRLFRDRPELQCLRCHAVGAEGGTVGPALDHVGRKPAAYLLQAVRDPSAAIAEGWPQGVPSAMPTGFDRVLTRLELRDLLAYLQSLK